MLEAGQEGEGGVTAARAAQFLAWCVSQPSMKTALLARLAQDTQVLVPSLEQGLAGDSSCQAAWVAVVAALCDPEISLSTSDTSSPEQRLADSLPDKDSLTTLVTCLLSSAEVKTFSCHSLVLRTLTVMTETGPTCDVVRWCLLAGPGKDKYLFSLLRRLAVEFSATNGDISSFLGLARSLHPPASETSVQFTDLISVLDSIPVDAAPPAPAPVTSWLPDPRPPLELWSARDTVVSAGDISSLQEQLSAVYWAGDQEPADTVQLDLLAVAHKYLAGLDLQSAAKEVTKERTLATDRKKKGVKKSLMETKVLQHTNIRSAFKTDPSRTRPPNTSRPPSLHVDDFLVLEMKGQQPTGPTGYNKQSMKAAKELFAQREAEAALKPPTLMREATREPVGFSRGRGRAERGTDRGGRSFRGGGTGNSRNFRRDSRGWSS